MIGILKQVFVTGRCLTGCNSDGRIIEDVASIQKSVVSILIGIAQARGLLTVNSPVSTYLSEGWSDAAPEREEKITIQHLLSMSAGLFLKDKKAEPETATEWRRMALQHQSLQLLD